MEKNITRTILGVPDRPEFGPNLFLVSPFRGEREERSFHRLPLIRGLNNTEFQKNVPTEEKKI